MSDRHRHQRRRRHHEAVERAGLQRRRRDRPGARHPHREPRQVQARLRRDTASGRIGLDHPALRCSGTSGSSRSRGQSARDLHLGGLRAAVRPERRLERVGLRAARHRRGSQWTDLDRARGQRPPCQLRSQQVHGAERARRDRPALSRGDGRCTRRRDRRSRGSRARRTPTTTTTTGSTSSTR